MTATSLPKRRSVRLPAYDYASHGAYFVTIVSAERACLFSNIIEGEVSLTALGEIIEQEWHRTAELRANVALDEFVVMPNHIHGILWITHEGFGTTRGVPQDAPTTRLFAAPSSGTLSAAINAFKGTVTRRARAELGLHDIWQRGFYEHVIRTDKSLSAIRQYIVDNPAAWAEDDENPENRRPS